MTANASRPGPLTALTAHPALQRLLQQWKAMAPRERAGVQLAAWALALLLLVLVGLQPALRTLKQAPVQLAQLDAQLQQVQQQSAEAQALRQLPAVPAAQAQQALKAATEFLGTGAKLDLQGERARVSVTELSAEALTRWLAEVRASARARPIEANLQRGPRGYSGQITLALGSAL